MKKYILALDQGTTSSRAIIFDRKQNPVCSAQKEFTQFYPNPGWVEQDPSEIWATQYGVMAEAIAKSGIAVSDIAAIGLTNQRETTIVWDRHTGRPIYNAIVWQCRRTAQICEDLKKSGIEEYVRENTGLRIDAYFSGTKIKWILDNVPGSREKAQNGDLAFGTVDTWLTWKLTGGKLHITDRTNASRTMLFNIKTMQWDKKLLNALGIPESMMPSVRSSSEIYGYTDICGTEVPVSGIAGDQQAALFGQCCFCEGEAKNTYGTGCFMLVNIGNEPYISKNGLITTVAASAAGEIPSYALEGSVFIGGAVIQWLRDQLGVIREAADSEYFARKVKNNGGVYVVPAFTGLGAPYWDMYARGIICGLTRGSNRNHIIRAALESVAYQSEDVLRSVKEDTGIPVCSLKTDGGAAANGFLMQFQADISDVKTVTAGVKETTALGAAMLAGLAVGFWKDRQDLLNNSHPGKTFLPSMSEDERSALLKGWHNAVNRTKGADEDGLV